MYSRLATPRATISRLQELGLYTKKSLGQHFLVDDAVIGRIIDAAALSMDDMVIEVGPGIGTLTLALQDTGAHLIAVEYDKDLVEPLRTITDPSLTTVLQADAARLKAEEIYQVLDGIVPAKGMSLHLVSNLPYQVAATVVLRFFEMFPQLESATVMVQREVADRITASIGTKQYGGYTIKLQLLARVVKRFEVARNSFLPPPRVDSTVVRLQRDMLTDTAQHYERTRRLIDMAFAMRRKTLRNNLCVHLSAARVDKALDHVGIDKTIRAEKLDAQTFRVLAEVLFAYGGI